MVILTISIERMNKMNNGVYKSILEEEFGDKNELIIKVFISEESINESITVKTNSKPYSFHFANKDELTHYPRIKIIKNKTNCGTIPVYLDKDMPLHELEKDDKCNIQSEGLPVKTEAIAFALYGRNEIIDYYNNSNEDTEARLVNKYNEFIDKVGGNKATDNKFKKVANKERDDRLK